MSIKRIKTGEKKNKIRTDPEKNKNTIVTDTPNYENSFLKNQIPIEP